MSGIVNSTGARSGVIGTTVGTPASSPITHLTTITDSGATLVVDGYFSSVYDLYKYYFSLNPTTNNTDMVIQFRDGSGDIGTSPNGTLQSGNYRSVTDGGYVNSSNPTTPSQISYSTWDHNYMLLGSKDQKNVTTWPVTGWVMVHYPLSTAKKQIITGTNLSYDTNSALKSMNMVGTLDGDVTDTITGITFTCDGGGIEGTVSLYGIKQ